MEQAKIALIKTDAPEGLIGQLVDPLQTLLSESVNVNYQGERVVQLLRLQQSDAFYRGIQNIAPQLDQTTGQIAWVSFGQSSGKQQIDSGNRAFDYNPRLTKAYGDKYVAVLGQRPFWNNNAEPDDPTNEQDRRGARNVNLLIQMFQSQWNIEVLNSELFYKTFKSGTILGYVRPVTDGNKFGYHEVPNMVPQEVQVGVDEFNQPIIESIPVQDGFKYYPKTSVEIDIIDGYISTWPFNVTQLHLTPWLVIESQRDRGILMSEYPNAREIVGSSVGATLGGDQTSATAAVVRSASQSQTGTVRTNANGLWSFRQTWLSPSQLHLIKDDAARAAALEQYPDGVRITQIESKIVEVVGKDLKKCFSECRPAMSDYLFCDGASWGMFNMEDFWSNLLAVTSETLETGIPQVLVNPDYADADAMNRSRYSPNRFISAIPRAGENLSNAFQPMPTSRFPDQIPGMFEVIKNTMESFYGLFPQVYGQMPNNLTLGQARMMLNQGLMQLGTPGKLATHFWESTFTNAVKMYVDVVKVNPTFKGQSIDLELVKNSCWHIKGTVGVPSSFAERKENLQDMVTQNPQLAQALQVMDPINARVVLSYLDMPELQNSTLDQIEAISEVIDQLWGQEPIFGPPGPDGQPQMQPSIEFDGVVFDPQVAAALARKSLVEANGQQRSGTPGYMNVRCFLEAANAAMPPQPAEPMKVQASVNLNDLPQNQMEAVLGAQGIQVPPPMAPPISTQSNMMEEDQKHQFQMESNEQKAALAPPPPPPQRGAPPRSKGSVN